MKSIIKLLIAVFLCLLLASCDIAPHRNMPPSDMPIILPEPETETSQSLRYIFLNDGCCWSNVVTYLKPDSLAMS
ncbi:MAG: hypothetical protein PWQ93_47 [Clostridiales bacterium]|nr:hypothetical protein [Clostridiales bacterium]